MLHCDFAFLLCSLLFFSWSSGASFLLHHAVGLAGCFLGLFANKLALFGLAIEVFFEATTPLLQVSIRMFRAAALLPWGIATLQHYRFLQVDLGC